MATTLQNPRLLQIHLHTFKHWKATMLYHQSKDSHYVQKFFGRKSLLSTEYYINIETTIFGESPNDQYTVKVANSKEKLVSCLESDFEYVCTKDDLTFLRRRK